MNIHVRTCSFQGYKSAVFIVDEITNAGTEEQCVVAIHWKDGGFWECMLLHLLVLIQSQLPLTNAYNSIAQCYKL